MRNVWKWYKENVNAIVGLCIVIGLLGGLAKLSVIDPIHQRFDDTNQRIDDLIAVVHQRFDAQDKVINQRFDDQNKAVNQRFDAVDQRFDDQNKAVGQRFDAVDQRFDIQDRLGEALASDVAALRRLSDRVSRIEGQIDLIMQQLQTADAPAP